MSIRGETIALGSRRKADAKRRVRGTVTIKTKAARTMGDRALREPASAASLSPVGEIAASATRLLAERGEDLLPEILRVDDADVNRSNRSVWTQEK